MDQKDREMREIRQKEIAEEAMNAERLEVSNLKP